MIYFKMNKSAKMCKKQTIVLTLICLFCSNVKSQDNSKILIDDIQLSVSYDVVFYDYIPGNGELNPDNADIDRVFLQIGKHSAHSYTDKENNADLKMMDFEKKRGLRSINTGMLRAQFGEIYKGVPKAGQQTIIMNMQAAGMYKYEEKMPSVKWELGKDTKNILGYKCTVATAKYRGREYEAWFTADIPLSYGPLWFGGLPGLIMEIADKKGHYVFVCTGIEKPTEPSQITFWNREYKEATRNKCRKVEKSYLRFPTQFFADYGIILKMDGKDYPPMPYNPIELK